MLSPLMSSVSSSLDLHDGALKLAEPMSTVGLSLNGSMTRVLAWILCAPEALASHLSPATLSRRDGQK